MTHKTKKSRINWGKIALISFVAWILSIVAFLGESALFLPSATANGGVYLPLHDGVLVSTIGLGAVSFLTFCVSLFVKLWSRSKAWALLAGVLIMSIPVGLLIFLTGVGITESQYKNPQTPTFAGVPTFTGQDLFDAVNAYRVQNGVKEVKLENGLCNNLAQRYFDIKAGLDEGVAHKGLDEWYKKNVEPYGSYQVSEDFAWGNTPQEVIKAWEGSPGHRLSILDPKNTLGCSYAAQGYGIIELGYKQSYTTRQATSQNQNPSRTGQIVSYHEWCGNKDISIYENELITKKSSDGNIYTMTQGDWDCYENYLKK